MAAVSPARSVLLFSRLPQAAGALACVLGALVLSGWIFGLSTLKAGLPGAVEMKPNTAVGLITTGLALCLLSGNAPPRLRAAGRALALAIGLLGLATLGEYLFGWALKIDEILFPDRAHAFNAVPGRMAPVSAMAFFCLGVALVLLSIARMRPLVWLASIVVTAIGAIGILGYLWDARELVTDNVLPPIAVHTALAFLLLGVGTIFAAEGSRALDSLLNPHRAAIELKFTLALSGAFLLLVVGGGIAYRSSDQSARIAKWATHVQEIRTQLGQLRAAVAEADVVRRDFLRTGLPQHRKDLLRLSAEARQIASALGQDIGQGGFLELQERFARLRSALAWLPLGQEGSHGPAGPGNAESLIAPGMQDADVAGIPDTRAAIRDLDDAAAGLLLRSEADAEHYRRVVLLTLMLTLLGAAAGFVVLLQSIRREMLARAASEAQILSLNADLERQVEARTAELASAQRRLSDLFELAPDALVIIDRGGTVVQVNRQAEALFGWPRSELVGRPVEVLFPPAARAQPDPARHFLETVTATAIGAGGRNLEGLRRDGTSFFLDVSLSPLETGAQPLIVAALRDATERKKVEQQILELNADLERRVTVRTAELNHAREAAEEANRAKSLFLATMSHEIRTPMNGVVGMLEVLARSELSEDQADAVHTIRQSAFSLLEIIDDILDFSKIEAGRLQLERTPVPLADLIEGICDTLAPVAAEKDVDLRVFVSPAVPPQAWGDSTRLRQILFNLAGNAIKFSAGRAQRRGRVGVRVDVQSGAAKNLRIQVSDNGIGMGPDTLANLFQSFRQGEQSTTRRFGGTGLGLAICKRLIALMNGRIEVQSNVGEGSLFTVTLPLEPIEGAPAPEETDLNGVDCVAIAADEQGEDLRTYLECAGARVQVCANIEGAAACAAARTRPVVIYADSIGVLSPTVLANTFAAAIDVRHLLITTGRRRRTASPASADLGIVEANCLRRASLLRAVAVAAGRASPRVMHRADDEDAAIVAGAPVSVAQAREKGELVLVAEDDSINQKVVLKQIELLGYAAEVADDGAEALRLWRAGRYALLLTDLHMPNLDGYGLAAAIRAEESKRAHPQARRMPIVALTANALRGEARRAREAGMDDYMTKPLQLAVLKEVLARWLPATDAVATEAPSRWESTAVAVDTGVLRSHIGDDPLLVRELLSDYRESAKRLLGQLQAAQASSDVRSLRSIAHRLKSSSRSVGALALGDACAELENACSAGAREEVTAAVEKLRTTMRDVNDELEVLLG